ncbi:hypothetical protein AAMO2058_001727100 [Amorphochlora amoebiformis]
MPAKDLKPFIKAPITCLAWNKDMSMVALCPNSSKVFIYETDCAVNSNKWNKEPKYTLDDHAMTVVGMDWCHSTNQIVTCSHDRNAYVWSLGVEKKVIREGKQVMIREDKWTPSLVILRINRAATAVKWAPSGAKFAVTSAMKQVRICSYNVDRKWWAAQTIKKHKSTVLDVDWCPNSKVI